MSNDSAQEICILGFIINGTELTVKLVDIPSGNACRLYTLGPKAFPCTAATFYKYFIPLITVVWQLFHRLIYGQHNFDSLIGGNMITRRVFKISQFSKNDGLSQDAPYFYLNLVYIFTSRIYFMLLTQFFL
ncbi:hypothetical protein BDC45DRAFT_538450 [Circinella umbellata]|nr:hypothetical protein BDC45DRAFT_538450 [Circinella umbellata]